MNLSGKKWEKAWNMMWAAYEKERRKERAHLMVCDGPLKAIAACDCTRDRTEANINTHRSIMLSQEYNGHLTEHELLQSLKGEKCLAVNGVLATADGAPGFAEGHIKMGSASYEIVFLDVPFYDAPSDRLFETGGVLTAPLIVSDHRIVCRNLFCAAGVRVEHGATLEVQEGATLVFSEAVVAGTLCGSLTGALTVVDEGLVNGNLYAGRIDLSGTPTLIGMYYGDQIKIADHAVVHMKEFGSMTTSIEAGSDVTLRFEDAEPLVLAIDPNDWRINGGHEGGDAGFVGTNTTGRSWYLRNTINPTDMLGRQWGPTLTGGVLAPGMANVGLMKIEPDLSLEVVGETEHNYALFMLNNKPITHIKGAIHIHVVEGVACPPEDMDVLEVSSVMGEGTDADPYHLAYRLKDPAYKFSSAEDVAVQAGTKKAVMARFPSIEQFGWQFAPERDGSGYTWYGYASDVKVEHWDGPTGQESYIVKVRRQAGTPC